MPELMPALFVGHGSPTNAMEINAFSRSWADMGQRLPEPLAIVTISAHWETAGTCITAMSQPATLYDFHGFPQVLYEMKYPAPGEPELARSIKQAIAAPAIFLDFSWGLDHGTWSVLCHMFPEAHIPVLQLSLDFNQSPAFHYQLGRKLKYLRSQGILVMGSGNMVHNLRVMTWQETAYDWAAAFDARLAALISAGDHPSLIDYPNLGEHAALAIPTNEHYLPLLYILAMQDETDRLSFFCEAVTLGSISMRSLVVGDL